MDIRIIRSKALRFTFSIFLVLVLSGGKYESIDTNEIFDSSSEDSIVIVGIKVSNIDVNRYLLSWHYYSPDHESRKKKFNAVIMKGDKYFRGGNKKLENVIYYVRRVEPGHFYLKGGIIYGYEQKMYLNLKGHLYHFETKPGTIYYVCDFDVAKHETGAPLVVDAGCDEDAAQEALTAYRRIQGRFVVVEPSVKEWPKKKK